MIFLKLLNNPCTHPPFVILDLAAKASGLGWPLPEELSDASLEERLFPSAAPSVTGIRFIPDFQKVHKELQCKKHVTLNLLWQEYKEQHPDGYQYSWFCHNYGIGQVILLWLCVMNIGQEKNCL